MSGSLLQLKKIMNKVFYLAATLLLYSCLEDLPLDSNIQQYASNNDISWFYDIDNQELLIQLDVNNIGRDNINHVYIKSLSDADSEYFEIFDNGLNGDIISNNGIYSILESNAFETSYNLNIRLDTYDNVIQDLQYDINFNSPEIVDNSFYPVLPLEHVLDENDVTFLNMVLAINDPDGRQDIEFVKFYIKKVSFFNGSLVNGSCDYTFVEENDYFWDPTWQMEYIGINDNEELIYNSQIPMNPIQSDIGCGGFGYVQFKFEVQDSKGFSDILEIDDLAQICPGVCE
tara:strand:- start:921 stop:1781 length:861 start_codon:yes stop_codon:yes gene_type:complete